MRAPASKAPKAPTDAQAAARLTRISKARDKVAAKQGRVSVANEELAVAELALAEALRS